MVRYWQLEMIALVWALFGFGATASSFHDLAKLSSYWGPIYDLGKLLLFGNS